MAAELIGACTCPLCRGRARLSLSKSKLATLTCNACNIQLFARSDRSDELLRGLLVKDAEPAPAAKPKPAPAPQPAAAPKPAATPAATPASEPAPVRTEKRRSLGFFPVE